MAIPTYDLAVIGSGPAGQKAAIAAAKLGKHVVMVDQQLMLGGGCLHTGTIPSKTLREAVLYLTGFRQRTFYGDDYAVKAKIRPSDLRFRVDEVVRRQRAVIHDQLRRNDVEVIGGLARFADAHTLEIASGDTKTRVRADNVVIACGTRPARPDNVPFEPQRVLDADELVIDIERSDGSSEFMRSLIIVGAGVIGLEYAAMASALGILVTVIEARPTFLEFVDQEITEALSYHLRRRNVVFRLGEKVVDISIKDGGPVLAHLESGKTVSGERLLYAAGRQGNGDRLNLEAAGLSCDERGRISVNDDYQTAVPHVYAAGDVIGFPSLASTSMEQGRLAACSMFGVECRHCPELLPFGIYTIPEISMVGQTEKQLTDTKVPYEIGVARYSEIVKAQMIGDDTGLLKLVFHAETLQLLGVHIIGDGAAELVHIGQMVMTAGGTIEMLRDTVFNYPTLAEAYKVAALDGLNRLARQGCGPAVPVCERPPARTARAARGSGR